VEQAAKKTTEAAKTGHGRRIIPTLLTYPPARGRV